MELFYFLIILVLNSGFIGRLLGAQIFIPFSKMTNCFLLIHPLITRIVLLNYDGSIHLSIGLIVSLIL